MDTAEGLQKVDEVLEAVGEKLGYGQKDTASQKEHLGIDQKCNTEILLSVTLICII